MKCDNTLTKKQHLEQLKGVDIKTALRKAEVDNVVDVNELILGTQQWYVRGDGVWFKKDYGRGSMYIKQ